MSTSASSPLRVDFIDPAQHQLPGRLGLTIAPGKRDDRWQRDLTVDLQRLRAEYDTGLLVSLMEPFEYRLLHIEGLFEAAQALGIRVARFPIVDVSVPPPSALPEFAALIWQVVDAMRGSRTVVVHCRGGKGRSGVVAACALVALGAEPNAAIAAVRRARPRAVETRAQEQWVSAFREHLAANPARSTTTQKAGSDGAPTEIILSHNSGSDQRPGVAGAAQGNFLAVPPDLSTHELSWLAHLLNGYEIAEQHLGTTCDVVATVSSSTSVRMVAGQALRWSCSPGSSCWCAVGGGSGTFQLTIANHTWRPWACSMRCKSGCARCRARSCLCRAASSRISRKRMPKTPREAPSPAASESKLSVSGQELVEPLLR